MQNENAYGKSTKIQPLHMLTFHKINKITPCNLILTCYSLRTLAKSHLYCYNRDGMRVPSTAITYWSHLNALRQTNQNVNITPSLLIVHLSYIIIKIVTIIGILTSKTRTEKKSKNAAVSSMLAPLMLQSQ